jgi:hypothetical protein
VACFKVGTSQTVLTKSQLLHRIEKKLPFPDENFAKSYEKLTNLTDRFSSAFHTILQKICQEKVELMYSKQGWLFRQLPQNRLNST